MPMENVDNLRDRFVGQRFYDTHLETGFTVVGITGGVPLALLQYDDGAGWDEAATNFTVDEDTARQVQVEADGLDSERYRPLGSGPRIDQICAPEEHVWNPWPDSLWPGGLSRDVRKQIPGEAQEFYNRLVRCKRCGLTGDVATQFGSYGGKGHHSTPWFCFECGDAFSGWDLGHYQDMPHCGDCVAKKEESRNKSSEDSGFTA